MEINKSDPISIGARIKELRERKGLMQKDLAHILGTSKETMNYWETGSRPIKSDVIIEIADYFNVSCDFILRGNAAEDTTVSRELGLLGGTIEELKLATEIIDRHKRKADLAGLSFKKLDKDGKHMEVTNPPELLEYAENTIKCVNLLFQERRSDKHLRTIDYIMNYIESEIFDDDVFDLKSFYDEGTANPKPISGRNLLDVELFNAHYAIERLRANNSKKGHTLLLY